jgi:hypothetical protein
MAEETTNSRQKKIERDVNLETGVIAFEVLGGTKGRMEFNFHDLPDQNKDRLGPFGLNHKLGDSAAGREGEEAEEAIIKTWEGLMANEWTTRAPAQPKVTKKAITEQLDQLPSEEAEAAKALLAKLGFKL